MRHFQVSVTIPVFNAAAYVQGAVESALSQPETAEIVLVEDASPDRSWEVCQQLTAMDNRIHLYRHPDGKNHGCGATRNLAVLKSTCEYIAFLDADDYFLPNRFTTAKQLFKADPELEGVYEAVGLHVEDKAGLQRWQAAGRSEAPLHTMTKRVPSERLFSTLVTGGAGSFHIDGLTVKRSIFKKVGYFDQDLPVHMDDVFFIKAAAMAKLMPGSLDEPVAMWRVHEHNRISAPRPKSVIYWMKLKYRYTLWYWSRSHLNKEQQGLLLQEMIDEARYRTRFNRPFPRRLYGLQKRVQLLLLPFDYPDVLKEGAFWRAFLISPSFWLSKLRG